MKEEILISICSATRHTTELSHHPLGKAFTNIEYHGTMSDLAERIAFAIEMEYDVVKKPDSNNDEVDQSEYLK